MKYQMYTEIFLFMLVIFFLVFLPVNNDIFRHIIGTLTMTMTFVIQPLTYLSGDVNFRNRVIHKGLWLAIKTELFWIPITNHSWTLVITQDNIDGADVMLPTKPKPKVNRYAKQEFSSIWSSVNFREHPCIM